MLKGTCTGMLSMLTRPHNSSVSSFLVVHEQRTGSCHGPLLGMPCVATNTTVQHGAAAYDCIVVAAYTPAACPPAQPVLSSMRQHQAEGCQHQMRSGPQAL